MYKTISLNGQWNLSGKRDNENISVPVQIPGYVHPALESAGLIPPMFWRDNAEKCQWVEDVEWTFTKAFTVDTTENLENARLIIGGVDTYADILINGAEVCKTSNMFIPVRANIGAFLRQGENEIKIVIHPYKGFVEGKPQKPAAFTWDRTYVRRIQCTFFWDWVNRFVSAGIWRDVAIEFPYSAQIENLFAETIDICKTSAAIKLQLTTAGAVENKCRFTAEVISPKGKTVWKKQGRVFGDVLKFQADIRDPELWWPAGYGEQPLYTVKVTLTDLNGKETDVKTQRIGIRTVRYEMLQDGENSPEAERTLVLREFYNQENENAGESLILLVNGERIFCKGGNWVPASPFPGTVSDEQYRNLTALVAEGSMNTLRVWGGGIYEPDVFYDFCDEAGVLLIHDFMLACGTYPDEDEEFFASFKAEIEETVIRLRHHACLAAWTGNNENGDGVDWDNPEMPNIKILNEVYVPLLSRLDPNRPFRPCSPYGGIGNTDMTIGDNHTGWWWTELDKIDHTSFDQVGRFSTESSIEGYPMPSVLRKFLSEEDILDKDSAMTEYHIKNNIYFEPMGILSVHNRLKKTTEIILGQGYDRYQHLYNLAYIQYEWARLSLEGMRRSKPYSGGILYWMYNDCWPALGYALVDWYGAPKAGWYGIRQSGAPIAASIKQNGQTLEFLALNDSLIGGQTEFTIKVCRKGQGIRELYSDTADLPVNENALLCTLSFESLGITGQRDEIVFLELHKNGEKISRARWYNGWLSEINLPETKVEAVLKKEGNAVQLTCKKGVALGLAIDGNLSPKNNFIDLLEGESAEIAFEKNADFDGVTVCGYNIKRIEL